MTITVLITLDNIEMILQGTIKFQVGSIFDLASLISLGSWPALKKKTTQQAMIDLGYTHTASSYLSNPKWNTPKLSSDWGYHVGVAD